MVSFYLSGNQPNSYIHYQLLGVNMQDSGIISLP